MHNTIRSDMRCKRNSDCAMTRMQNKTNSVVNPRYYTTKNVSSKFTSCTPPLTTKSIMGIHLTRRFDCFSVCICLCACECVCVCARVRVRVCVWLARYAILSDPQRRKVYDAALLQRIRASQGCNITSPRDQSELLWDAASRVCDACVYNNTHNDTNTYDTQRD